MRRASRILVRMKSSSRTRPRLASRLLASWFVLAAVASGGIGMSACNGGGVTPAGNGGPTGGAGVGESCDATHTCRSGLKCDSTTSKCAPSGDVANGSPCSIGLECASGSCGPKRTCDPAGAGAVGEVCGGDADCGKGLRCAFDGTGFFPKCVAGGTVDKGQGCTATKECFQGLVCISGQCTDYVAGPDEADPKGIPPTPIPVAPWDGEKCAAPVTGAITALWQLPGASGTPAGADFYSLPFPNDAARDKSGRVSFAKHPHNATPAIGFDAVKLYLDALEPEAFGPYSTVFFRFDGHFDFATIAPKDKPSHIGFVDVTAGATFGDPHGYAASYTDGRNHYICTDSIAVRPDRGDPLRAGHTYAVYLLRGITAKSDGSEAKAAPQLQALLGASAPTDAALAAAYDSYKPLRDHLAKKSIATTDVLNAAVFTVGDAHTIAASLRSSERLATAPTATPWVKCKAGVASPCPQHDGDRGCGAESADFDELHALITLPIFQDGTAPYATSGGGFGKPDSSGNIPVVRSEAVCMSLTVPKGTAPAGGWPIAIYAHGTGGSYRSQAIDGSATMLSKIDLGGGVTSGFAVLGIDQVAHGPRRCGGGTCTSTASPNDVFFNFANPAAARYNALQGAADQHSLVRFTETLTGIDAAVTGSAIKLDPTKTVYWGHSQGATEGAMFLAYDPSIKGAVLSGEGAGLIEALITKSAPVDIKDVLWIALSESSPRDVGLYHPVLSLLEQWVGPSDPVNFAALDVYPSVPAAATPFPRNVFQPSGTKDTFTPWETQATFISAAGLALVAPILDVDVTPPPAASAQGNAKLGALTATAAVRQYAPVGFDGHFVAFRNADAKSDVVKFLARVAAGATPKLPE